MSEILTQNLINGNSKTIDFDFGRQTKATTAAAGTENSLTSRIINH